MHSSTSAACSARWICRGTRRSRAYVATTRIDSGSTARTLWIAAARFNLSPQQTLKRVAVNVGEAGHRPAFQDHGVGRRKRVLLNRLDAPALDLDQDVLGAVAEPGLLGVPLARTVQEIIGMRTPRSRATSIARS